MSPRTAAVHPRASAPPIPPHVLLHSVSDRKQLNWPPAGDKPAPVTTAREYFSKTWGSLSKEKSSASQKPSSLPPAPTILDLSSNFIMLIHEWSTTAAGKLRIRSLTSSHPSAQNKSPRPPVAHTPGGTAPRPPAGDELRGQSQRVALKAGWRGPLKTEGPPPPQAHPGPGGMSRFLEPREVTGSWEGPCGPTLHRPPHRPSALSAEPTRGRTADTLGCRADGRGPRS